jgi:hypothetical protein
MVWYLMVEFRRPDAGQLLILSVVPFLIIYHTYIQGNPLGELELIFVSIIYVLMLVSIVVKGWLGSPNYLLIIGFLVALFSVGLYLQESDSVLLVMAFGGVLMGVRGVQLRLQQSTHSAP